ncbi:YutD family protein [Streptococcus loxodontisalivarius]|uniref:Uncharacterized protein YutD n=1 Tax=Streptococcus loxodontisalivarius TaxID=1349415 RepID=A0ABS2PRB8_9STRE|nr:YutD-like domain-containing protein [Streptococcus loxodontisalivarius]MBM7642583.1 uncharacterized protein YutD [Streptococcus loxodontisalivarius]
MRKEITADMYNYNKFPGPQFVFFDDQVKSDDYQFRLVENVKDAFDATVFSQRFSEILLKYDYIVGDWGNEQLRLRGFYKDRADIKRLSRISRLEDYIKEYCNYGCAYFVLENDQPIEIVFEEEKFPKRKRRRKPKSKAQTESAQQEQVKSKRSRSKKPSQAKSQDQSPKSEAKTFTSKKRKPSRSQKARPTREENQSANKGQQSFTIRKKKSD